MKFYLEKYKGRSSRHICPNCGKRSFTYYVDETDNPLSKEVGRCDHESSCGYHFTPKMFFDNNPDFKYKDSFDKPNNNIAKPKRKTDYIPLELIQKSQGMNNTLIDYLKKFWNEKELLEVTNMYRLGCTSKREIIFPQIGKEGFCHTGKVMLYDKNGHRVKRECDCVDWLHSRLMKKQKKQSSDFNLQQVLFGEHLISKRKDAVIAITESEKSAVICSLMFPSFIWVSCGGKNGLNLERCSVLKGRNVMLYPDADAVELWSSKAEELKKVCKSVRVSDWYKSEPSGSKRDIADVILEEKEKNQIRPTTIGDICKWMDELGMKGCIYGS